MITHLCTDSGFIDFIITHFNKHSKCENTFIVITYEDKIKKINQYENVLILKPNDSNILKICNQSTAVIVHSIQGYNSTYVWKINKSVKVVWVSWGIGVYFTNEFKKKYHSLYCEKTLTSLNKFKSKQSIKEIIALRFPFLYSYYHLIKNGFHHSIYSRRKSINRYDYIATVIPQEFGIIKNVFKLKQKTKNLEFSYGNLQSLVGSFYKSDFKLGNNIIIGNSSHFTNNTLDVFQLIYDLKVNRQIICPLSYGNIFHKEHIEHEGKKLFKQNFNSLSSFIPLEEYSKIISSCCVMIMNQKRQQALGNIILGLYLGMKVYLNRQNPLLEYFKSQGIIIFNFSEDFKNSESALSPLKKQERLNNRNILESIWGEKSIDSKIKFIIEEIDK